MKKVLIVCVMMCYGLFSCTSTEQSARESIVGVWEVTRVVMESRVPNQGQETIEDTSAVGVWTITNSNIDYAYQFLDSTITNSFGYTLEVSKENAGFLRIDRFDIVGMENYRVRFGDQTSDAHCDATHIVLEREVQSDTSTTLTVLDLSKQ